MRTLAETIELVTNTHSSLFSKTDVLELLYAIQEKEIHVPYPQTDTKSVAVIKSVIEDFLIDIDKTIKNHDYNHCADLESAEFDLYKNEIQLSSVYVDGNEVYEVIKGIIEDNIVELEYKEQEKNAETHNA